MHTYRQAYIHICIYHLCVLALSLDPVKHGICGVCIWCVCLCACAVCETAESHECDAQDLKRKVRSALEEQCKTSKDTDACSEPQAGILDWALWLFSNTPAHQLTDDSMCPLSRQSFVGKATCVFTSNCKIHALLNSVYQTIERLPSRSMGPRHSPAIIHL